MDNYAEMNVGETRPFTHRNVWEGEAAEEYQMLQEFFRGTGVCFEINPTYKKEPSGDKLSGFTITRTK